MLLGFGRRGGPPNLTERAGLSTCPGRHRDLRQAACRGRHRHVIDGANEKTGGTHGRSALCAGLGGSPRERTGRDLMSVNSKRVFYVKYLANPVYIDIMKARPDVRLDRIENESPEDFYAPILSAAHVYQIGAARDELAPHFHVDAAFLKRTPNLLLVSSNGAGFDPVDAEACTDAGVLVLNQSGGNAHSVAEHALAMMLTLSKRIIQSDRKLRRESNVNRNELVGNEIEHKTVGIIGLGNVGRRIAALCKGLFGMKVLAYDPYLTAEVMAE